MKLKILVVGVFLLLFVCAFPASAAVQDDSIGVTYIVTPLMFGDVGVLEPLASTTSSVTQGMTKYFSHHVYPGMTDLDVKLSWTLPPNYNSLKMKIFSPNGEFAVEFTDLYESSNPNGIIPVKIKDVSGLVSGDWTVTVTGDDVVGSQSFTLIMNSY